MLSTTPDPLISFAGRERARVKTRTIVCGTALAGISFLAPGTASARAADLSPAEATRIAAEAYIYAYPLVTMDVTRLVTTNLRAGERPDFGPMNQFGHMRAFPPAGFKEVVRPNFDTLYSPVWLDLTRGPVIVSVPDTGGRYYMLPMLDMWTDVIAVPGKRTSGTQAADFAVMGPCWQGSLPGGVIPIHSSTPYVWVIGRAQTNGPGDYENVHRIQDGYKVTPLSAWGREAAPVEAPEPDPSVDMETPPLVQVNGMSAQRYFEYAAQLMKLHPPHLSDGSILLRMRRIGLEPGQDFDCDSLSEELQRALDEGAAQGLKTIQEAAANQREARNGWAISTAVMGVCDNEYLQRAVITLVGLGANPPEDAIYPLNVADANGDPVVGGRRYVMHSAAAELPPVGAFWSLTMYGGDGFPVENALHRYAIGDRSGLQFNDDGSLDLYIQPDSPGADKEANWLPSPREGAVGLTMRLYAPEPPVLNGEWAPPPVEPVD